MPRFKKKEPPFPEFRLLTEEELKTYPYPWDFLYAMSQDELDAQWIANNPEVQRLIAEAQLREQLREKRRAEEKEDKTQLKKQRARSAARAARTKKSDGRNNWGNDGPDAVSHHASRGGWRMIEQGAVSENHNQDSIIRDALSR